jgi:AraC family transcriptional regulator of arabinose operon
MDSLAFPILTNMDSELPLHLTSVGHWDHQDRVRRPEGYLNYQWLQVVSGTGEVIVGSKRLVVKPGQGFFLFPHEPHSYQPLTEPWELQWVSFNGSLSESLLHRGGIKQSGVYSATDPDILITHMKNMYVIANTSNPFSGIECSKLLYAFLLDLIRSVLSSSSSPSPTQNYLKLHPVIQFTEANCHRPVTIDEMANCIGVSVQYLCHLFKITLKMRPMEYVNRERINRSKEWMFREPGLKMQDIASRVGFDNASYFSSVFKRIVGKSPEQFKKFHGMRG